ncbi:MAG: riboflavin synthase [Deltaproteobacteria bacterium]|uniref:Riboflavin synthase n=1 Tax=Candidatus Zymogenus saltonus TaxID=2844893 RepID=A0A9D8KGR0_9DELT|nr:riboflavin synthase [Candidatus Zymogenus saltonus]
MFTGIIEDVGIVRGLRKAGEVSIITVETGMDLTDTKIGDSISVDGVCLTVVAVEGKGFSVEASPETVSRSTLKGIRTSDRVNLEKALALGGRLGGHMVQGHVDGVGTVKRIDRDSDSLIIKIVPPRGVFRYIVDKGSVSVNGISLTVNSISDDSFTINIIRHTAENTNLLDIKVGDEVNLEADIIGKYVERFLSKDREKWEGLTLTKLAEEGYL